MSEKIQSAVNQYRSAVNRYQSEPPSLPSFLSKFFNPQNPQVDRMISALEDCFEKQLDGLMLMEYLNKWLSEEELKALQDSNNILLEPSLRRIMGLADTKPGNEVEEVNAFCAKLDRVGNSLSQLGDARINSFEKDHPKSLNALLASMSPAEAEQIRRHLSGPKCNGWEGRADLPLTTLIVQGGGGSVRGINDLADHIWVAIKESPALQDYIEYEQLVASIASLKQSLHLLSFNGRIDEKKLLLAAPHGELKKAAQIMGEEAAVNRILGELPEWIAPTSPTQRPK